MKNKFFLMSVWVFGAATFNVNAVTLEEAKAMDPHNYPILRPCSEHGQMRDRCIGVVMPDGSQSEKCTPVKDPTCPA